VLLALVAADIRAATAYVTDQLVLGVYANQKGEGPRLATLHSGAVVDTIGVGVDTTQVRLADGTLGWVKSAYLTNAEPAVVRLKQLQDELDRTRATTPELAAAAASAPAPSAAAASAAAGPVRPVAKPSIAGWLAGMAGALGCGFWLGHAVLARRIRIKFGGIKVY
jgi:hypothetical protein